MLDRGGRAQGLSIMRMENWRSIRSVAIFAVALAAGEVCTQAFASAGCSTVNGGEFKNTTNGTAIGANPLQLPGLRSGTNLASRSTLSLSAPPVPNIGH